MRHGVHSSLSATTSREPYRTPLPLLLKKTLQLAAPFILIVALAIVSYYRAQVAAEEKHANTLNEYAVQDLHVALQQLIRNIKGDAQLIASHPLLASVLANPTGEESRQLAEEWLAFATQKRLYDQIRLLDLQGKELLRVNLAADGAVLIPRAQLQDKVNRYYFRESIALAPGEIYLSPIDLNVENNTIEQPIKPMLRIAVPIADRQGRKAGLVILNYLAANLLANIDAHSIMTEAQTVLLNQNGYYLRGFRPDDEWAFMYPEATRPSGNFANAFPEVWQHLRDQQRGYLINEKGLFNYQWFSTASDEAEATPYARRLVVLSMISTERIAALTAPYRHAAWAALLLSLPVILIISATASRFRLRELHAQQRLRESEGQLRQILESVGEGILGLDAYGKLTFANTRAIQLTGFQPDEMMGNMLHNLIHAFRKEKADHSAEECPLLSSLIDGRRHNADNDLFQRKGGDAFPVEYISSPIIKDGIVHGGVVSFFDITSRKKAEQRLEHLVLYDALTDLANKHLFLEHLNQQMATATRTAQHTALLYIDIDRFKQVNDALGHDHGDEVLIEVAKRLTAISQQGDTVARIGSDEFALLPAGSFAESELAAHNAQLIADDVMVTLQQPILLNGDTIRLTASIGITIFPNQDGNDAATILSQADTAVSNAKEAGRNATRFYTSEMERNTKEWLAIHNRLLEALAYDAFTLVYQPKVKHDGRLVGLEALLRWNDEVLGVVSPAKFVPIAEQSGLIVQLSDFVLATACKQIREWIDAGFGDSFGHVAVNISANHFSHKDFVEYVVGHITRHEIPPHLLELEITEGTLVNDIADTRQKVRALRELGIRFSIDDFGTGYSSLSYLQQLPIDRLKIDRAFVTNVDKNPDQQTIVSAIIMLAKGLSIEVIAEGVENEKEMQLLLDSGCHEFQGYHFYRPMNADSLVELFQKNN